jgi:hypothetical protein
MAFDNTNRGSIWPNKKKRPDKQDADFTGSINVNGVEYWLNAWKRKEGASPDSPSLSFTVRPKDEQPRQTPQKAAPARQDDPISTGRGRNADMDDDIPFAPEFR